MSIICKSLPIFDDGRIEGYVSTIPDYVKKYQQGADITMYFSAILDKKPKQWGTFKHDKTTENAKQIEGLASGVYLTFETKENEAITVKVGLSYTSIANARLNMASEAKELTFDQAKKNALQIWNENLGKIEVEGKNENDKIKFYTGLFHMLLGRGLASDVNGAYPKNNGEIGQIPLNSKGEPIHNHYNTDAIWGGFWNITQLWALICPEYYADWIQSQLLVYKETGWLGDGIACSRYVSGVGTNFTGLAFAAAYNCGIKNFDVDLAYQAAFKNEMEWENRPKGAGKIDLRNFIEKGYSYYANALERDSSRYAASHVLEYSFSCYSVAQFAKSLGKTNDYEKLMKLSGNWKNIYDPATKYFRPRNTKGDFISHFNPSDPHQGFQEGNAIQYSFYVPHTPEELIHLTGRDTFNNRLDSIFTEAQKNIFGGGNTINAFAGLSSLYNQGNQPCLYIPWLFNFSGKPYLTQKWVRAICDEFYGIDEIHGYGYGQDEDQGQLGAWYVMSSIGLFDVKGLTEINPSFQIGSPLFDKITIKLPKGTKKNQFVIETKNNSKESFYIQNVLINEVKNTSLKISYSDVLKGGSMTLIMGKIPLK